MKFNKDLIEQIKAANPIEDIVQQFMDEYGGPIKHVAGEIHAHHHIWDLKSDAGTGLYVTPGNQMWHCFSCKKGGDVIHLVQSFLFGYDYEQRNIPQFVSAISWLADRAGIPFNAPEDDDPEFAERQIIYSIYNDFITYCEKNSTRNLNPDKMMEYINLVMERYPLTQEMILRSRICYFDRKWTGPFWNKMLEKYTKEELLGSGLWRINRKNEVNCLFQNRLIIPYLQRGEVVYMIGRETKFSWYEDQSTGEKKNFDGGKKFKKIPIYVEDKDYTHSISKLVRNDYVFGVDTIKKGEDLIITEGIGDCLVLHQQGYRAISPVTVSFKNEMLEPVANRLKSVRQIYICNDTEISESGKTGALRMYNFFISKGIDAKIIELPLEEGETHKDVAEFFEKHNNDEFKTLIQNAKSAIDIEIEKITPQSHRLDVQKLWEKILNLDSFNKDMKAEELAKRLGKRAKTLKDWFGDGKKGALTSKMVFEAPAKIVPSQYFRIDDTGLKTAYTTVWVPVEVKGIDDETKVENRPHLLEVEYNSEGQCDKRIRDLTVEPLNPVDMLRLPDEVLTFDRWRLSTRYPFSVGNFMTIKNAPKPEVEAVYHSLYQIFDDYFWYPNDYEKIIQTLYIMLTYFYQLFPAIPGLHMTGPKNSGKSNAMMIALWTAFNAFKIVSVKESFLFRTAHTTGGCFIVDEAEKFTGEEKHKDNDEVLQLLRARYKNGDAVPRQRKVLDGDFKTELFETYGPTYIGSINPLEDAMSSRMIILECLTKDNLDSLKNFTNDNIEIKNKCADIKDKMYVLMMLDFPRVLAADKIIIEQNKSGGKLYHIKNREWEKWRPILTIAQWVDMSSKHTSIKIVDALIKIQKDKETLRKNSEMSMNHELVVLEIMYDILVNRKGVSNNFKILDIGNGNVSVPADGFYSKINEQMRAMSIQKHFDMQYKAHFDNILRKTQVWQLGDGVVDKGKITINVERLNSAINRLKAG